MFVRYPYRRDNYYRSRAAPMDIDRDRDESPIWAMPVAKKKLSKNDDNETRNRNAGNKKGFFSSMRKKEDAEISNSSQGELVKYDPVNNNSKKKNKYEDEDEKKTEYNHDIIEESESDYEEDSIETENQMSYEYQHPNQIMKPSMLYSNNPYYGEVQQKKSVLKDTSFPQLLLSYSKFFFNVLLLVIAVWIIFYFIKIIKSDVNLKYNEHLADNMKDISKCYEQYDMNKCSSDDFKIPALEDTCKVWEACMSKNPDDIRIMMLGAEVVSEVLNRFIDPLSMKTTIFIIILCIAFFFIIWKIGSDPSKKQNKENSRQVDDSVSNNGIQMGKEGMRMCPPQAMNSEFIGNGVMYPIAPAAIYPGSGPYSMPVSYPSVYPYPAYPMYHNEPDVVYSSKPSPNLSRKASYHSRPRPEPSSKKNYKFVKSSSYSHRNPYQTRFRVNPESRPPPRRRGRYYYDEEDDYYEMYDDDNRYYDDDYYEY